MDTTVDSAGSAGSAALEALDAFFQQRALQCPVDTSKYNVYAAFGDAALGEAAPYWVAAVRGERFQLTLAEGILYRPHIVDEIYAQIVASLAKRVPRGIMVKGPQGIGKSHSLVNLVLKLESTKDYLVTFVPDCEQWTSARFLIESICASFGSTPRDAMGVSFRPHFDYEFYLLELINEIDTQLERLGKKWVFVFDQINRIFARPALALAKDVGVLPFPFNMIKQVMKAGRITSVISASANNEVSYKEQHEGFEEYIHTIGMTHDELFRAFDSKINTQNIQEVVEYSGGVPFYAVDYANDPVRFQARVNASVHHAIERLAPLRSWPLVRDSIISSILGTASSTDRYDKKFLICENVNAAESEWRYLPLFPAVLCAYKRHLWEVLMEYIEVEEGRLLDVCKSRETTNDTRGRLFELMVVRRCRSSGIEIKAGDVQLRVGTTTEHFGGKVLPKLTAESPDRVYVPLDPNFPAIDFFVKHGSNVYGIQAHVSSHDDVVSSFVGLCKQAGWFENLSVYLLYLGPENQVTNLVQKLVEPATYIPTITASMRGQANRYHIVRRVISRGSVSCLADLQWPDGCSL